MNNNNPKINSSANIFADGSVQYRGFILITLFLLGVSIIAAIDIGHVDLPLFENIKNWFECSAKAEQCGNPIQQQIIFEIRLPRILMAMLTGAGLSVTGAILQSVTRNPLADPYLFGISSGASLGAVIVMSFFAGGSLSLTFGALFGGALSVLLMLVLAGKSAVQVEKLLLSGVAVSFMLSAFTSLVLYYSSPEITSSLLFWMMGSFSNSQWGELWMPAWVLFFGVSLFFVYRRWITAIQAGDETALTLGVPVNQLRLIMLLICAAITAVLVAHVGGIGFVGLMIPHITRFIVGAQIHRVMWGSILLGSVFMIWVDVIARAILPHQVLPIGIVTSAIGSIFFFIILKHRSYQADQR